MNVNTGELRVIPENLTEEEAEKLLSEGFIKVPSEFDEEARRELAGKDSIMLDMKKKTPLTDWAKSVKQGRNEKCACGSGKKYKHCCGK